DRGGSNDSYDQTTGVRTMSNVQHSPQPREEDSGVEDTKVEPIATSRTTSRSSRLSTRRRNIWFLLVLLLLGVVTIVALGSGGAQPSGQANVTQPGTPAATATKTQSTTPPALTA